MRNASTERRWLQTAGLPLTPPAQAVRDELDELDRVEITEFTNRIVLFNPDGEPIGLLDVNPAVLARIKAKVGTPANERQPDPSKGDTVVRPIDPGSPEAALAITGPRILSTPIEPTPIDLPDYEPENGLHEESWCETTSRMRVINWLIVGAIAWAAIAAAYFIV